MNHKFSPRLIALALALVVVAALSGVVYGASSTVSGNAQKAIKVVRENSTTASVTVNSTTFVDIPNATTSIVVPTTTNGSLLVARFQGHGSIIQSTGCIVRILVGNTSMEPAGNFNFMGQTDVTKSLATSGAIERSLAVMGGTYTVKAQLRLTAAANTSSQCQLTAWHFAVERHAR